MTQMYSVQSPRSATMFGVTPGTVPQYVPPPAPPKNSSPRYRSMSSSLVPFRDESKLVALRYDQTVQAQPPIPIPPPRSSRRPPPRPISCDTVRSPIVVPPPRPAPPTEQHPALRTISSPRIEAIEKRDSGHSPATPSSSWTIREDSETDDEDPFAYENIQKFPEIKPLTLITRSASPSIYARVSESNSRASAPSISPALSDGETVSPTSPTTPSSNFSRFARSFSLRSSRSNSSKSSFSKMNRLRKKATNPENANLANLSNLANDGKERGPGVENPGYPLNRQDRSAPKSISGILSPASDPHGSPIISTTIPTDSLLEDDFMTQLSFSKRGSIIFGAKHPRKSFRTAHAGTMADQESASANTNENAELEQSREPRSFPLVPTKTSASANTKEPASKSSALGSGAPDNAKTNSLPPTPRQPPPSVRVISAEAEKESQKVRSLYESGEGLNWEEGAGRASIDGRPKPLVEHPTREDENDALSELAGNPIPLSASISSPQDKEMRHQHELAGGIEDWEGVHGADVDRYGFISVKQPLENNRPATAYETTAVHFSERKQRNVLVRKDAASLSLRLKRGPRRKLSARSLNTQASGLSTASHRSALSAIRQATNLLPHNRDRKLLDEAGDILAPHPALVNAEEDASFEKKMAESKMKEMERSEKWRKMAKKVGTDGLGMMFEFDMNNPKLVERTWKGIPDCWRSSAWYSFLASSAKASNEPFATDDELKADFHRLIEEPSPDDGQIDLDVPRTINQHIMFRRRYRGGQRLLFRVLHSLSLYFPETGYVQGMAPLAATFLSYFDEERCFIMLVRLWKYRGLNRIYQSGFEELMAALKDFEHDWLASRDVASKLSELCIDPTAYATKWYLTLFNLSIPFAVQLRVWDAFLLLGSSPDVPSNPNKSAAEQPSSQGLEVLHATSLAIIDTLRPTLLDSDFENAMKSLTSWIPIKDGQGFMELVQLEYKRHQSKQKI